jgi:hypothetical protein
MLSVPPGKVDEQSLLALVVRPRREGGHLTKPVDVHCGGGGLGRCRLTIPAGKRMPGTRCSQGASQLLPEPSIGRIALGVGDASAPAVAGRNRYAGILPRQPTLRSPNGTDSRTGRLHPKTAKNPMQHRAARRSKRAADARLHRGFSADKRAHGNVKLSCVGGRWCSAG